MAAVDFQLPALQTPQTQTPEQNAQALALIENSRSLAEQRQAQAEQRQQQAAQIAQQAGIRSAWQAAMRASHGDPDAAAEALDKVNPDAAAYGREQTNTARTKALDVATKTADLHTKIVGQTADLLNGINTQDPNDYAAKVLAVRGMAGNDKNMQQFLQTTLPMPGEQGFDPSQIPQYVQRAQNAAIPYKDYWDKMQASVTAANNGDAVKSLAYALDAEKNGSPQDLLKTIASHRALGMKSDVAQPFVDAITSGAYKADPLFFAKLGGITNPKEAGELTGTIPGTTTPTEAAKEHAASEATAAMNAQTERMKANQATTPVKPIEPWSPDFKVAQDLAYGRMTPGFFRTLEAYNRDAGKKAALYATAAQLNPDFNEADFERGFKFISSPRIASQLASLDNVQSGVSDLLKASDAATRTGSPLLNKVVIPAGSLVLGNQKYSNWQTARTAFADELSGALGYGSATDMSREMGFNMTDQNLSPAAFRSGIQDIVIPFVERKRASLLKQGSVYGTSANNSGVTNSHAGEAYTGEVRTTSDGRTIGRLSNGQIVEVSKSGSGWTVKGG